MKSLISPLRVVLLALLSVVTPALGQSFSSLVADGDSADRSFTPVKALACYLPAKKIEPNNVSLLLKISRQYRHMMTDVTNTDQKLDYGRLALANDSRLASLAPSDSNAQLSEAITYGKMMPYLGKSEQIAAVPVIKAAADRALKLNPRNDDAWHVLGRWNQGLANISSIKRALGSMLYGKLPTGSFEESIRCFKMAIAIDPSRARNYIELGHTYALAGQGETARGFLKKGLSLPNQEKDDPAMKKLGRDTLAGL
jgi:tetratricopeptide (TPR) repeat protein